jgi:hypothetical protein
MSTNLVMKLYYGKLGQICYVLGYNLQNERENICHVKFICDNLLSM